MDISALRFTWWVPFRQQDLESLKRDMKAERDCSNKAPRSPDEIPGISMYLLPFIEKLHYDT
jgi:hypothetical protein